MNKRGWGGWPTCASLDPHPEAPVLRGPKGTSAQSNSRVSLFNEQCKRHARGLSGFVPMIGAHLCCAFLTMSGGHHRDRRLDQKHCLRDELGGRARQNENLDLSERRTHPAAQSHSRRLARHRGGIGASGLTGDLVNPEKPKVPFRSFSSFLIEPCGGLLPVICKPYLYISLYISLSISLYTSLSLYISLYIFRSLYRCDAMRCDMRCDTVRRQAGRHIWVRRV